jgi:hypothetical protein
MMERNDGSWLEPRQVREHEQSVAKDWRFFSLYRIGHRGWRRVQGLDMRFNTLLSVIECVQACILSVELGGKVWFKEHKEGEDRKKEKKKKVTNYSYFKALSRVFWASYQEKV